MELRYEIWLFASIGALGSFLLLGAFMSTSTAFQDVYQDQIILAVFGTFAVLVFGVPESPFAQPRNLVLTYAASAFGSMGITRLLGLNLAYRNHLDTPFWAPSLASSDAPTAISFLTHFILGTGHFL